MTVRLLVAEGVVADGDLLGSSDLLVGASSAGAVLVLGTVPASAGDGGDGAASKAPSLQEMLPHGLSVVGQVVGSNGSAPTPSSSNSPWITLDAETRAFSVEPAATLPRGGQRPSLLPPNEAFALVRVALPPCTAEQLEQLLLDDDKNPSTLLFASTAPGGDKTALFSSSASLSSASAPLALSSSGVTTFCPLLDTSAHTASAAAPVFEYTPPNDERQRPQPSIQLDVLVVVPTTTHPAALARSHLLPALRAQLAAARRALASSSSGAVVAVRAMHFAPPMLGFAVTMVYPLVGGGGASSSSSSSLAEAALAPLRRAAHAALGLPLDRPLLRAANALDLPAATVGGTTTTSASTTMTNPASISKKLVAVHRALPSPPPLSAPSVTTALVDGDYEYCHYLQDRVQDAGWGCAYRSLQTLVSWFRLNGFCGGGGGGGGSSSSSPLDGRAPHIEAQRALVRLGDKPASFAGSNEWIGAVEVGYVLDEWLGVQNRVVRANSGGEVGAVARELARHFREQGTPVMVGGGVLAYTLLGVQHDGDTGDASFLILDPHYAGGDSEERDLRGKIVGGGWVGWKRVGDKAAAGGELFAHEAFYNFLCPLRPREV